MRLSRFIAVGGACAVLSNALVIALVHYGRGTVSASVLAFGPVLLVGYMLHARLTFGTQPSGPSFVRYAAAVAANFPLWIASLYLCRDVLGLSIAVAAPFATAVLFLWNFLSARWAFLKRVRQVPAGAPGS